ncbi:MAG: AgmX/PglI C-terminal domain-containing protein [Myxococcales bacterium]|nr:AgmX/PglI C-terminal domain-containing protein [Myxococcales bacterium]
MATVVGACATRPAPTPQPPANAIAPEPAAATGAADAPAAPAADAPRPLHLEHAPTAGVLGSSTLSSAGQFASLTGGSDPDDPAPVASAQLGAATIVGGLSEAAVRGVIKRSLGRITYCYEQSLLGDPTLAGQLTVQLEIGPDGQVTAADAAGFHQEIASCVAASVRAIVFPRPARGSVRVTQPITFSYR